MIPVKKDPLKPTVITRRISLKVGTESNNALIKDSMKAFLAELTNLLESKGCRLIGHIKGMIGRPGSEQVLFFSVTDFIQEPCFKGSLIKGGDEAQLLINVIVYGIEATEAGKALDECLSRYPLYQGKYE